jgi:hypothetical protein
MAGNQTPLRVFIATPNGLGGRGGIDRMNDMLIDVMSAAPEMNVVVERLVTRGNGNIVFAPIVLALGLFRLWRAARQRKVDVLHICLSLKGSAYRKVIVASFARYCGVPYVVHLHGGGFEYFWLTVGARLRRAIDRMFVETKRSSFSVATGSMSLPAGSRKHTTRSRCFRTLPTARRLKTSLPAIAASA